MDGCGGVHTHLLRYQGKDVALSVRYKRTSDTFDFREDRLLELDVVKANGGKAIDLKQVNEVAPRRCSMPRASERIDVKPCAGLHLVGRIVRDYDRAYSRDQGVVDGQNLANSPWPKPLNRITLTAARQMRQGRSTRLKICSAGLVCRL
eukprot:5065353-Pleurochrysis_carterae.AAC.1